jgi:HK97 family phage portal protein
VKLFRPQNNWDMKSPESWWKNTGSYSTSSGVRITETSALTFSACLACTRVLSETLASLPLMMLEQVDYRTTRKATEHPLWTLLHDQPNPEQDIMSCLDMQTAFQVNWGDAFFEVQRNSLKEIVALWPIHPSRIPLCNIVRNGTNPSSYHMIVAGEPGEIVFYVNNDDGTRSPLAASDVFHVPGILSQNGVTGQSIVKWGANSIAGAIAAERHATALFKNGAVSNVSLKYSKKLSEEATSRLRKQWSERYAGVDNHYSPFILEDGMEVDTLLNMSPEATQLILARQFGQADVARVYRVQPHKIGDLTRSTNNNIESENLSFITDTMLPWIIRWEKAMQRQLLTAAEKKKYRFKFNINGLLRGDQQARGEFYQKLFNLGALSPNDIRELEDMNPVKGGDQYFVQGNNAVPLDRIDELTQATIDKAKAPPPAQVAPTAAPDDDSPDTATNAARLEEQRAMWISVLAEHHAELPDEMKKVLQELPAAVSQLVNRNSNEDAVIREMQATAAMDSVKEALTLAIQAEANQLMKYESRAAREAAKKPQTFLSWRDEFYPKFTSKLAAAIHVFSPAAAKVGVVFDGTVQAEAYVIASLAALEPLLSLTCDQLETGVETVVNSWEHRPQKLAEELFRSAA